MTAWKDNSPLKLNIRPSIHLSECICMNIQISDLIMHDIYSFCWIIIIFLNVFYCVYTKLSASCTKAMFTCLSKFCLLSNQINHDDSCFLFFLKFLCERAHIKIHNFSTFYLFESSSFYFVWFYPIFSQILPVLSHSLHSHFYFHFVFH